VRIHEQLIPWEQDRCIKIDDSYEHEVFQQSERRRFVFILDLPHPELRPEELEVLGGLSKAFGSAARPEPARSLRVSDWGGEGSGLSTGGDQSHTDRSAGG
jgi:hypothetical protein